MLAAGIVYAQAKRTPEDNRRAVEILEERVSGMRERNQLEFAAVRELIQEHEKQMEVRISSLDKLLLGLAFANIGTGAVVGLDKMSYYRKKKQAGGD